MLSELRCITFSYNPRAIISDNGSAIAVARMAVRVIVWNSMISWSEMSGLLFFGGRGRGLNVGCVKR